MNMSFRCVWRRAYRDGRIALGRNPKDKDAMGPCFSESNLPTTEVKAHEMCG